MSDDRVAVSGRATALLRLLTALPGRRDDALAVVDGLFGDALAASSSSLAMPMTLRSGGTVLTLEPA